VGFVKFANGRADAAPPNSSEPLRGGCIHEGGAVLSIARLRDAK
jgi:hypothetical protein